MENELVYYQRFGGGEYSFTFRLLSDKKEFELLVEDVDSANQWNGSFNDRYIENLTKRTGNYKNFETFYKMLINAFEKENSSVTARLLNFSDLKAMKRENSADISELNRLRSQNEENERKYLILVYTAEFDKIQYPLPLSYIGKPDVVDQQNKIRELKAEVKTLKNTCVKDSSKTAEELLIICENLRKERDSLREELVLHKRRRTTAGRTVDENERLQDQVIFLEKELNNLKSKHRRVEITERTKHSKLIDELQRLRDSESSLKVRVRTLVNELIFYKKPQRNSLNNYPPSCSNPRKTKIPSKALSDPENNFKVYGRSCPQRCTSSIRSSPRRFNPTAYIDEKRKKEEVTKKLRTERIREKLSSRTSSVDSGRLNYPPRPSSAASSVASDDEISRGAPVKQKNPSDNGRRSFNSWNKNYVTPKQINKRKDKYEEYSDSSFDCDSATTSTRKDRVVQLEDVDERLKKLQEMMKSAFS